MITRADYEEAIAAIEKAMCQLEPDGKPCAICKGTDHQAWECGFNPVLAVMERDRLNAFIDEVHEHIHQKRPT
jgi:cobalamin biosynthesis Co2+ chelatase CbiK